MRAPSSVSYRVTASAAPRGSTRDVAALSGRSTIAEVYPSLWSRGFPREDRTDDQHDAYSIVEWLRREDMDGRLLRLFEPPLPERDRAIAQVEGWILGVA
jgi:hypothetical protein